MSVALTRRDAPVSVGLLAAVAVVSVAGLTQLSGSVAVLLATFLGAVVFGAALFYEGVAVVLISGLVMTRAAAVVADHGVPDFLTPLAFFILLLTLLKPRADTPGRLPLLTVAFGAYGTVLLAGVLWAGDAEATNTVFRYFVQDAFIALAVMALVRSPRALRQALWTIALGGTFLALVSILQSASGNFDNDYFGFAKAAIANIVGEQNNYRIGGPFGDGNFFAQILVVVVAIGAERFMRARGSGARFLALAIAAIASTATLLTFSRGGALALVVVLILTVTSLKPRPATVIIAFLVGAFVVWQFLPPQYGQRVSALRDVVPGMESSQLIADPALAGRTSEWHAGLQMFIEHPIGGVGVGNFKSQYLNYAQDIGLDLRGEERNAHSLVVQTLAETGMVGFALLGAIVVGAFASLRRARRALVGLGDADAAGLVIGLRNALIGYFIASLFLHAAYPQLMWVLLALAWATPQIVRSDGPEVVTADVVA